ncbi:sigma-70 family RNA polymerase sigma factor [Kriegella sp. EG-1]|nr:sigma-70 family RNA polymerase sigma factor [Flavobacteriaceae bacterium EG-1]
MNINLTYEKRLIGEDIPKSNSETKDINLKMSDSQLWLEFQSGNEIAYALIYKKNASILYGYGLKIVNDKELIKDCIQDLFIELWNSKHKLSKVNSIKAYLIKSIRRKIIASCIKQRRTNLDLASKPNLKILTTSSAEYDLIEKQNYNLQLTKLKRALNRLTDRQKEIIHLKFQEQLSYVEIAEIMSLSKKGAYKLMGRSIIFLRKCMSEVTE